MNGKENGGERRAPEASPVDARPWSRSVWSATLRVAFRFLPRNTILLWQEARAAYLVVVSQKASRISELVKPLQGGELDPHYLGYFDCFNRQLFFEAHEVLEQLWLKERRGPNDLFYRGLIQFAGAFVHLQKKRPKSAVSLLRLAKRNLANYAPIYSSLDVANLLAQIDRWLANLEMPQALEFHLTPENAPRLELLPQPIADTH